jgi:hypothetical protein
MVARKTVKSTECLDFCRPWYPSVMDDSQHAEPAFCMCHDRYIINFRLTMPCAYIECSLLMSSFLSCEVLLCEVSIAITVLDTLY